MKTMLPDGLCVRNMSLEGLTPDAVLDELRLKLGRQVVQSPLHARSLLMRAPTLQCRTVQLPTARGALSSRSAKPPASKQVSLAGVTTQGFFSRMSVSGCWTWSLPPRPWRSQQRLWLRCTAAFATPLLCAVLLYICAAAISVQAEQFWWRTGRRLVAPIRLAHHDVGASIRGFTCKADACARIVMR
jgi:hypothetical protein